MARKASTAPRKLPRQERAQFTVDAILIATRKVLAEEGRERATTNRIAEVAGVSIGSLYQYFPNKEVLIELVRAVPGVRRVKTVRSRWTGSNATIDMVITVERGLSAGDGHAIADQIEAKLRDELSVADALVHVEPEA